MSNNYNIEVVTLSRRKKGFMTQKTPAKGMIKRIQDAIIILIISIFLPVSSMANTCQGRFVNPMTDICWSCLLPISIGGFNIGKGSSPKKRDTKNPSSPLCLCTKGNIPIPGISVGFWEPARLIDVTRTPLCMTNLGGLQLGGGNLSKVSSYNRGYGKHHSHRSFSS